MKKLCILTFLLIIATSVGGSLRGMHTKNRRLGDDDVVLFAEYDWEDGAKDISESPARHDGVLQDQAIADDGTLTVFFDSGGVDLGVMPELDGASKVLFKFEDVKFTNLPDNSRYSVLLGGGEQKWWVGVHFTHIDDVNAATHLVFNVGGWGRNTDGFDFDYKVKVGEGVVSNFDSIEYRFDGTKPTNQRLAIRHDGGSWIEGGWDAHGDFFRSFPTSLERLQINDGSRADWDHWDGTVGTVSLSASKSDVFYQVSNGVCREHADGTGTGSNDKDYVVYKREDDANVDYEWCKNQCDTSSSCTGMEYRDMWDTSQCEIWSSSIGGSQNMDRHYCHVKVNECTDNSGCQDDEECHNGSCVDLPGHDVSYLKNLGVCRVNSDGTGKGRDGSEYDLYLNQNYQWCTDKCSEDKDCTGIEHRWSPATDQQCEIWHAKIKSVLDAPGSNCDKKVYGDTPIEEPVYVSYDEEYGVCRSNPDQTGMGSNGNEYDLYLDVDFQWCKNKCSEDSDCVGFEQRYWPLDRQQCEIWHTEIKSTLYMDNSKCVTKIFT